MTTLLLIAHTPLASAWKAVAEHVNTGPVPELNALDVLPTWTGEDVVREARALLGEESNGPLLVLTDMKGGTPCNGASRLAEGRGDVRVACGTNVPMVLRALTYRKLGPLELHAKVVEGGCGGINASSDLHCDAH